MQVDIAKQIESKLPPIKKEIFSDELNIYGFSHIIAKRLGLKNVPFSYGGWLHGWRFLPVKQKELFVSNYDKKGFFVVTTEEEKSYLNSIGIYNVKAGSMPFIYADEVPGIERVPRSLLVMPGHFTKLCEGELPYSREDYLQYLKKYTQHFDHIVFCLNQNCLKLGFWVKELEQAKIPYVVGAESCDMNSFERLRTIMQHFEYMTTNQIGSHVLYASLCECKVSIADEFTYYVKEKVGKRDKVFKDNMKPEIINELYPQFCVEPHKAKLNVEWAEKASGAKNMIPPEEIAELFAWNNKIVQLYGLFSGALMRCENKQIFKRIYLHIMKRIARLFISPAKKHPE